MLFVLLLALLAGCATVPESSEVTVLRRVGDAGEPTAPPGPVRGAGPLETVRGWVLASGSSAERHAAARQFLTAPAAGAWDDGAAPVVVEDRVDTVFAERAPEAGVAVRVRANRLGTLSPAGVFVAQPGRIDVVVGLVELDGQWRITELPPGTLVRQSDLRANTRPVRTWFAGAASGLPVAETRYLQVSPARSLPARSLDLLAGGPSEGLAGAAVSALPPTAVVRAADLVDPGGALAVDLAGIGAPDAATRERMARQIVLTLAGIGVLRVRLLADGLPLVPGRPELGVGDVLAGVPPAQRERRDLPPDPVPADPATASTTAEPDPAVPADAPAVLVGGRVRSLADPAVDLLGDSALRVSAAATGPDDRIAVVAADGPGRQRLFLGRSGSAPAGTAVEGATISRPTWNARGTAVGVVVDRTRVVRVSAGRPTSTPTEPADPANPTDAADAVPGTVRPVEAPALAALGPVTVARLSPDQTRLAAVVDGRVAVGVLVPGPDGTVTVRGAQVLRPGPAEPALDGVLDVAWAGSDRLVAVGAGRAVTAVSADGLDLADVPTVNLTPPVTAVAASPGRPLLVTDQSGLWSFDFDGSGVWRSLPGGTAGSVPIYPG